MAKAKSENDPFEVVAEALKCDRDALSLDSAMKRTHGWDSLGHVSVITHIEEAYDVSISDDEMMSLISMRAIVSFDERICQAERDNE